MYTETLSQKKAWLLHFQEATGASENRQTPESLAPVWVRDQDRKDCMLCGIEFTLLHRRVWASFLASLR